MGRIEAVKQKAANGLVRVLTSLQKGSLPDIVPERVPYDGDLQCGRFFLGTKTGLLYYDGETIWRLFGGRVYGITKYDNRWYVNWNYPVKIGDKRFSQAGSIISFRFVDEEVVGLRSEAAPLDQEIHQIDAWNGFLYVTDTANNRILKFRINSGGLERVNEYYPNGRVENGKESSNYVHINSVYRGRWGRVYLMYHNHTSNTGQPSQLAILDDEWNVVEIVDTHAEDAHNVFEDGSDLVYCDSQNGRLVRSGEKIWGRDIYLRGLAATEQWWLIGGSEFAERSQRAKKSAYVYCVDRTTKELRESIFIKDCGSLYETRLIHPKDTAVSSNNIKRVEKAHNIKK